MTTPVPDSHPQTPLVRFLRSQSPRRRRLVALLLLAAFFSVPVAYGWRVVTAERVTIQLTDCPEQPGRDQGCRGMWTLPDGTKGSGVVDGYPPTNGDGVSVQGWATGSRATAQLIIWLLWPINGVVVVVGAALTLLVVGLRLRKATGRG